MNILFTICGRAGSKGFKNKNLKSLKGIPLLYYTLAVIDLYKKEHMDDRVYVVLNTDSKDLIKLVQTQTIVPGIFVIEREQELAGDVVPKVAVIQSTYQRIKKRYNLDVVVDLDITSPMRRVCDIEHAIDKLKEKRTTDVVVSVVPARRSPYFNMVEKRGEYYRKICASEHTARQQVPESYELNASIYAYNPLFLETELEKTLLDYCCDIAVMRDYLVLDIDSEEDFEMMDKLLDIFVEKDEGLRKVIDYLECFPKVSEESLKENER